ncbi:MAG: oxidoreductase [Amphritea sp.]
MADSSHVIKTAVVGFGLSATVFHIPFIRASSAFELVAVSSSQKDAVKQSFPELKVYDTAQSMIEESDAELIIITAPNEVHYSLAHLALGHNKHVIIEKPFVTNVEQGRELIEWAESQNKVLAVFHNRRWDGDFLTVKHLINTHQLGDVKYFESHFDRFRPVVQQRWREQSGDGSGILFDLGPHLIDQALDLFGMPEAVTARCLATRENAEVTDFFNLWLHYPDNEVVLQSSPYAAASNVRFHVQGTEGSYLKHGLDPQEARLRQGVMPNKTDWSAETPEEYGAFYHAEGHFVVPTQLGGYQHFFQNVAEAISGKSDLMVTPHEALNTLKIIELAIQSSNAGKTLAVS